MGDLDITLFVDDSGDSVQARELLASHGIRFESLPSTGPKLPAVQAGQGMYYGLHDISQLVSELAALSEKTQK